MKFLSNSLLWITLGTFAAGTVVTSAKPSPDKDWLITASHNFNKAREQRISPNGLDDKRERINNLLMAKPGAKKAPAINNSFSNLDDIQFLEAPDGSIWYATAKFDFEETVVGDENYSYVQRKLKGFHYTIYDSAFKEVGTIDDTIEYKDDETGSAFYELCSVITQKFFNYDNNYELIFCFGANTTENVNRYYSKAYSLGGAKDVAGNDEPVMVIDGTLGDAVNAARDKWSENFYLTFLTEESDPYAEDFQTYLESNKMVLTTYKKATYGGMPQVVAENKIQYIKLPGDQQNVPAMFSFAQDGRAYFVFSEYEKSFFVDPVGFDESITEDNSLLINIYSLGGYDSEMQVEKKVSIPAVQTAGDKLLWTYYSLGALDYERDIYKDGDNYKFVIAKQKCIVGDDDSTVDSYYIYNDKGEEEMTLIEDIGGFIPLSDVPGYENQYMFINVTSLGYVLTFIDLPSGNVSMKITNVVDDYSLTSYMDRIPAGLSYKYVFKAMNPEQVGDDTIERFVWLSSKGELIKVDRVNLGEEVAYARPFVDQSVMSPYFFNTDDEQEYIFQVKRYKKNGASGTDESFLITAANNYANLMEVTADSQKGTLAMFGPIVGENPSLFVVYRKNDLYNADFYSLPFTKFAGGDGSVSNPYLIATAGDFGQIGKNLTASYKIINDIDFSDYNVSAIHGAFMGVLDGGSHLLYNITMDGVAGLFEYISDGSVVKNLNLMDVDFNCHGISQVGVLAATALGAKIENVHVYGLNAYATDSAEPDFGGLIGRASNYTNISGCSVNGVIDMPNSSVGGIVAKTLTSTKVVASSFVGTINAFTEVGGIVGSAGNIADSFTDCHVDASITAKNTVGGIAGSTARSPITRCYVEGSIKATNSTSRFADYGPRAGGIVGELTPDYGNSTTPEGEDGTAEKLDPVTNCFVNLSSIEGYVAESAPGYATQHNTIHRIIGKSSINYTPEVVDEDEDYNPVYGKLNAEETAINNNYASALLTACDKDATADHNTVEGKSVNPDELSATWFKETLGFKHGADSDAPWSESSDFDPWLHHELETIVNPAKLSVMENHEFAIDVYLVRAVPFTEEEFIGNFSYDCTDESVVEMTGDMSYSGGVASISFKALKPGNATITMFGAKCEITVDADPNSGIVEITDGSATSVKVIPDAEGLTVYNAAGHEVEVYTISGMRCFAAVATTDNLHIALSSGLYVVKAGDDAVKCLVK